MIKEMVRPLNKPLNSGLRILPEFIRRVLIQLDPVANSHYELAKPVTFAGDFEIEVDATVPTGDGIYTLIGGSGSGMRVVIFGSTHPSNPNRLAIVTVDVGGGQTRFLDGLEGKLCNFYVRRVGSTVSIGANGQEATSLTSASDFEVSAIGVYGDFTSNPFDGIISNVVLRDLDTPSNTQTFKLNQLNSDIEYPVENVFGSELWGSPVINAGWTDDGDGTYTHTGAQSEIYVESTLVEDEAYLCRFEVIGAGLATIQLGGAPTNGKNKATNISAGIHEILLSAESIGGLNRIRVLSATDVTVSNISVKQITNAVEYIVIGTGLPDRDTYTLVDGYWTGSDIVTQSIWENPFAAQNQWSYDAGTNAWSLTGDGSISQLQLLSLSDQPTLMQLDGYVTAIDGDGIKPVGDAFPIPISTIGGYSVTVDLAVNTVQVFKRSTGVVNATLTKPSIKRLIEVA